jgi:HEXXH motif-containing protein
VREHGLLLDVLFDGQDPFLDRYDAPRLQALGPELDRWRHRLTAGWEILAGRHPELAVLVAETVRTVVPLASPVAGRPASATEETSFGAIALTLPPMDWRWQRHSSMSPITRSWVPSPTSNR